MSDEASKTLAKMGVGHLKGVLTEEDGAVVKTTVDGGEGWGWEVRLKKEKRMVPLLTIWARVKYEANWLEKTELLSKLPSIEERDEVGGWGCQTIRENSLSMMLSLSKPPSIEYRDEVGGYGYGKKTLIDLLLYWNHLWSSRGMRLGDMK